MIKPIEEMKDNKNELYMTIKDNSYISNQEYSKTENYKKPILSL